MLSEQEKRDSFYSFERLPFERLQKYYDGLYSRTDEREAKFGSHHIIIARKKTEQNINYFHVEVSRNKSEKPWRKNWERTIRFDLFEKEVLLGLLRLELPRIEVKVGDYVWNEEKIDDQSWPNHNVFAQRQMALSLVGWLENITKTRKFTNPPITASIFR